MSEYLTLDGAHRAVREFIEFGSIFGVGTHSYKMGLDVEARQSQTHGKCRVEIYVHFTRDDGPEWLEKAAGTLAKKFCAGCEPRVTVCYNVPMGYPPEPTIGPDTGEVSYEFPVVLG